MPIPTQCQPILDRIKVLESQKRAAQESSPRGLAALIKRYNTLIQAEQRALDECKRIHGIQPPQPLYTSFEGTATFTTDFPQAPGTYTGAIECGFFFDGTRTTVTMTHLYIAPVTFSTPFGNNILSINKIGGGNGIYSKQTGDLVVGLKLRFDSSLDLPFIEEDSDLSISLSTATPSGSPVTPTGQFAMAGSGIFQGGNFLNGHTGTIVATGTITPLP